MSRKKGATAGETKKAKAETSDTADKVSQMAERKAAPRVSSVIPPVPVALLERHPALPQRSEVLEAFAHDYPHVLARAVELAQKLAEPEPKPNKKARIEPPTLTGLRPSRDDKARPTQMALPELDLSHETAPTVSEPAPEPAFEPPPAVLAHDPFSVESAEADDDADAFFASLRGERMKTEEDVVFGAFADTAQVSAPSAAPDAAMAPAPSAQTEAAAPSAEPSEGATVMIAAMPDDEPPSATEERTTMIQAIDDAPSEDAAPADAGESSGDAQGEASTDAKTRKSRKATKRKRG